MMKGKMKIFLAIAAIFPLFDIWGVFLVEFADDFSDCRIDFLVCEDVLC